MNLSNYIQRSNVGDNSFEFASNRPPMSGKVRGFSQGKKNKKPTKLDISDVSPKFSSNFIDGGYDTDHGYLG
jgi:hypothetical protein